MATHRLLIVDPVNRTGTCSECGTTTLAKKGERWRCATANRSTVSSWKKSNPERARAQVARNVVRRSGQVREHELLSTDMLSMTGECAKDGSVFIGRYGRGWVCPNNVVPCPCDDELTWAYWPPNYTLAPYLLCEDCCNALARGFVHQGLLEPVLELTWPDNRVSWDSAVWELEAA